jgi:predicted small metal-binding protein
MSDISDALKRSSYFTCIFAIAALDLNDEVMLNASIEHIQQSHNLTA